MVLANGSLAGLSKYQALKIRLSCILIRLFVKVSLADSWLIKPMPACLPKLNLKFSLGLKVYRLGLRTT